MSPAGSDEQSTPRLRRSHGELSAPRRQSEARIAIQSGDVELSGYLARPPVQTAARGGKPGLVLCHGFPAGPRGAATSAQTYPEFADRLAAEAGWYVLTFNFRGTGLSGGDFSLAGWLADLRAAIEHLGEQPGITGVWLAGFSTGGSLALCVAAEDERVRGVAALAAPADFRDWSSDARRFLQHAREVGVVRDKDFPPDLSAWAHEFRDIQPVERVAKIPPRPLLIVHGSSDDVVPLSDARALVEAVHGEGELRVVAGAGHRLRHDPRAVAILLGWMDRQQ